MLLKSKILLLSAMLAGLILGLSSVGAQVQRVQVPEPELIKAATENNRRLLAHDVLPLYARQQRRGLLPGFTTETKGLTGYDLISVESEMSFDLPAGKVFGKSSVTLEGVTDGVDEVGFWLDPMDDFSVTLEAQELTYKVFSGYLVVTLPAPLNDGDTITLEFADEGVPDCSPGFFGMKFCNLDEDISYFGGCPWIPEKLSYSEDDLLDQYEIAFSLTLPDGYTSAASAWLQSIDDNGDDTFTHNWSSDRPASGVNFAFAPFDVFEATSGSGVVSSIYTLPGHDAYGQVWADMDAEIIDYFEGLFSDYLYEKIDSIQVLQELGGGFATMSAVFIYEDAFDREPGGDYFAEGIFAHEIGHEWWAYMVPLSEYDAPWLNEGFASFSANNYSATIWDDYLVDYYMYKMEAEMIMYLISPDQELPLSEMDLDRISQDHYFMLTYEKGAYLLRMLQHVLGEDDFYKGMRAYAEGPGTLGTTTDIFQETMEEASGEELDWFFDEWAWGTGWPHYKFGFELEGDEDAGYILTVNIEQMQDELFDMPVPIAIGVGEDDEDRRTITHTERINERTHSFSYEVDEYIRGATLDPDYLVMARRQPALTGDINGSGDVDGFDLLYLAYALNSDIEDDYYNWIGECDYNFDGEINQKDVTLLAENFTKEWGDE